MGGYSSHAAIHLKNYCDCEDAVTDAVELAASLGALAVVGRDWPIVHCIPLYRWTCGSTEMFT